MTTGARIELDLTGCPGTRWGPVVTTNPGVVAPASSAPDPVAGSARALLTATGPGQAVLGVMAVSACATPAAPFRLTVVVSPSATARAGVMSTREPDPPAGSGSKAGLLVPTGHQAVAVFGTATGLGLESSQVPFGNGLDRDGRP